MIVIRLQDTLDKYSISQRKLAKITGIRLSTINSMCQNKTQRIDRDHLDKICEVLDCEITDILKHIKEQSE